MQSSHEIHSPLGRIVITGSCVLLFASLTFSLGGCGKAKKNARIGASDSIPALSESADQQKTSESASEQSGSDAKTEDGTDEDPCVVASMAPELESDDAVVDADDTKGELENKGKGKKSSPSPTPTSSGSPEKKECPKPKPSSTPSPSPTTAPASLDGAKLYTQACANCHGTKAQTDVNNKTAAGITDAIAKVGTMKNIQLSSAEIGAISNYLMAP